MIKLTTKLCLTFGVIHALMWFWVTPVAAEQKTIEQMERALESMGACRLSLSDKKCDLNILDPQTKSLLQKFHDARNRLQGSYSTTNSDASNNTLGGCYDSYITKPSPFMGNSGEVFVLSDGSVWEVKYEYEYMYEYSPSVVICPSKNILLIDGKKLNVQSLSGGSSSETGDIIESNISGMWNGWQGDTIVKLVNGQIWEQTGLALSLSLGLGSEVFIFKKDNIYYMQIEDEDDPVAVQRLR